MNLVAPQQKGAFLRAQLLPHSSVETLLATPRLPKEGVIQRTFRSEGSRVQHHKDHGDVTSYVSTGGRWRTRTAGILALAGGYGLGQALATSASTGRA